MHPSYIAFAIPLFLFFMGLEYYYARRKGWNLFRFAESVANINVGIAERLLDIVTMAPFYYFFVYIYEHYALWHFSPGVWTWIGIFLLTDLVWYWYHRLAHEINVFWAAHVVHHQSEDFNYTVSARITVFQSAIRCLFWGLLPLAGFPPAMISIFLLIHGIYPFFIHTQAIGKLGWFEYIFVTPSHHRVHHSSNPQYLDKNYGDILIIWDKLFGTFTEEKEQPVYGLTKPLDSYSFLWQHFHYPLELLVALKRTPGLVNRLKLLFGRPDALDPRIRAALEKKLQRKRTFLQPTATHRVYITLQTSLSLLLLFFVIYRYETLPATIVFLLGAFILVSLINTGAILEQRSWIFYLELARLGLLLAGLEYYQPYLATTLCIGTGTGLLLYFLRPIRKRYLQLLFREAKS